MLLAGDELGRSQGGNNNAYCHDSEISWLDWEHVDHDFLGFVKDLLKLRREHMILHRQRFLHPGTRWYRNDGQIMGANDWSTSYAKAIALFVGGITDNAGFAFYVTFNAHFEPLQFRIPAELRHRWTVLLNTVQPRLSTVEHPLNESTFSVAAHSIVLLRGTGIGRH